MSKNLKKINMREKVAIVILNWNGWRDTVECLLSLENLEYINYKVYLIDNNSTDDSVAHIIDIFPDINIIRSHKNLGFAGGNNLGIQRAIEENCEFIWLLNNDTTVNNQALTALVKKSTENLERGLIGSVIIEYYDPVKIQAWGGGSIYEPLGLTKLFDQPVVDQEIDYIHGASMFIPKRVFLDIGLLDERFFFFMEDAELSLRIAQKYKIAVAEDSIVYHKGGSSLKSQNSHKNITADKYYVASTGKFMKIRGSSFIFVLIRFILIILNRFYKLELNRIPTITKAFWLGYFE